MSPTWSAAAVLAALVVLPAHAGAQARRPVPADPDAAELAAYRLNVETLQKVSVAMRTFQSALEQDPKYAGYVAAQKELQSLQEKRMPTAADQRRIQALEQQLEQMSADLDAGDAPTLTDMQHKIAAMPHMAEALAAAGLSAREYAKFTLTMIQAGFVAGMKKAGQLRQPPPGVAMTNVQFMIDHEKEISALTAQMQGR
jgi:cell fate (sporulation/competence/biofilm development) regulator YlbF (YheA/YmcA/DUF963 family)